MIFHSGLSQVEVGKNHGQVVVKVANGVTCADTPRQVRAHEAHGGKFINTSVTQQGDRELFIRYLLCLIFSPFLT